MSAIYETLPRSAFWRPAVVEAGPAGLTELFAPKFKIGPTDRMATAGSCFAQRVGQALRGAGMLVLDVEPAPPGLDAAQAKTYGFGLYSGRYGNIYTTGQLRQLLEDTRHRALRAEAVWQRDGRYFDALRPGIEPAGCETVAEVEALRRFHLSRLRELFAKTEVFIFTLGMTECWLDVETGTIFPVAPGVLCEPSEDRLVRFHNQSVSEILGDLAVVRKLLRRFNPAMKMILTVSPVPLTATASGRHVLVATTASKAILRAAVDDFVARMPDVDYMPSYEVITNPAAASRYFGDNLRSIQPEGVEQVMAQFLSAYGLAHVEKFASTPVLLQAAVQDDLICEEALAEAFVDGPDPP